MAAVAQFVNTNGGNLATTLCIDSAVEGQGLPCNPGTPPAVRWDTIGLGPAPSNDLCSCAAGSSNSTVTFYAQGSCHINSRYNISDTCRFLQQQKIASADVSRTNAL